MSKTDRRRIVSTDHKTTRVELLVQGQCSDYLEEWVPNDGVYPAWEDWDESKGVWVPRFARTVHNLVVDTAAEVFVSGLGNLQTGAQFHALGQGEVAWDPIPPAPAKTDVDLFDEIFRKVIGSIGYVQEETGQATSGDADTLVDATIAGNFPDDFFNGARLIITAGTNAGEDRKVIDFIGASGTFELDPTFPFTAPIDATSVYEINVPTVAITNKIELVTTFGSNEGTGTIREHGLFGINATAALDSGFLINEIRHPKIDKTLFSSLTRAMRIKVTIA